MFINGTEYLYSKHSQNNTRRDCHAAAAMAQTAEAAKKFGHVFATNEKERIAFFVYTNQMECNIRQSGRAGGRPNE